MKSPAFQFYAGDYLGSARVAEMTLEEEGAYIRALLYCWNHGSLPADVERLARIIGKGCSTSVATTVQRMFNEHPTEPERLIHDRLELEREKQQKHKAQRSEAGKKSAEIRAKVNDRSTSVEASVENSLQRNGNLSSSSSISSSDINTLHTQADPWKAKGYDKPESLDVVVQVAEMSGFTKDVAERYWNKRRSTGWTKPNGGQQVPIADWRADFATIAKMIEGDIRKEQEPKPNQQPQRRDVKSSDLDWNFIMGKKK